MCGRRRKVLRLYRDPTDEARSPPARSACFPHPVQMSQRGVRAAVQKAHLVVYHEESYYTYRPSDAVAVRTSHVDDVRAGYSPWHGGPRGVLSGTLRLRVVYFLLADSTTWPSSPATYTQGVQFWRA